MTALRSFLYLNVPMLNDYLSAKEGGLPGDHTRVDRAANKRGMAGSIGVPAVKVEGDKRSETVSEVTVVSAMTEAAKFQRLYEHLEVDGEIQFYELFEPESWGKIRRNDVVECDVELKLPELRSLAATASEMGELAKVASAITGQELLDSEARAAIEGIGKIAEFGTTKGLAVRMNPVASLEYTFVAYLDPRSVIGGEERLSGQATVVGKVQRVLAKGERIELVNVTETISKMNRQQRRRISKKDMPSILSDVVKPPAAVLIPVAIFV